MYANELTATLGKLLEKTRTKFLGVYAADHPPCIRELLIHTPCCFVSNTDPCNKGGTHWVAFYIPNTYTLEFFDSYGRPPAYFGLHVPNTMKLIHNTRQFQALFSEVCGQYCILFIFERVIGITFPNFIKKLESQTPIPSPNSSLSSFSSGFFSPSNSSSALSPVRPSPLPMLTPQDHLVCNSVSRLQMSLNKF